LKQMQDHHFSKFDQTMPFLDHHLTQP
jgi:hypothetical protein